MKYAMKQVITLLLILSLTVSCDHEIQEKKLDPDLERSRIEETIKNTIAWAKDKDTSLLYSIIADDERCLEVHPADRVVKGISEFRLAEEFCLPRFKSLL